MIELRNVVHKYVMVKLIKVLFFATLIVPNLAIADRAQILVFAVASTKNALDAAIREYNTQKKQKFCPFMEAPPR